MNDVKDRPLPPVLRSRKYSAPDIIEDWGLGWHLGRVVEYLEASTFKAFPIDDLRAAREHLIRKITVLGEFREDDPMPASRASIGPKDIVRDWDLSVPLAGVLAVIYGRRQYDVDMLSEALSFLERRIAVMEV